MCMRNKQSMLSPNQQRSHWLHGRRTHCKQGEEFLLLVLCVSLLMARCMAYNFTVAQLPKTLQGTKRVLAVVTVTHAECDALLINALLRNYAEMCEIGYEVHAVLITQSAKASSGCFSEHSPPRRYCVRLQLNVPTTTAVCAQQASNGPSQRPCAAMHREVFSLLSNKYDYFLSQQHDMDVKRRHLEYFVKWTNHFKGAPKPTIPGFTRFEYTDALATEGLHNKWHHPAAIMHMAEGGVINIVNINNVTCLAPYKAYSAFYFITQDQLKTAMNRTSWSADFNIMWWRVNKHFQQHWLMHYYNVAIPMENLLESMVFHITNKYTAYCVEDSLLVSNNSDHNSCIDIDEIKYFVANCTGQPANLGKAGYLYPSLIGNKTYVHYKDASSPTPCGACLAAGKVAEAKLTFRGPALAGQPLKEFGDIDAKVECHDWIPMQEREKCLNKSGVWTYDNCSDNPLGQPNQEEFN